MERLLDLLRGREEAIVGRWLESIYALYPKDTSAFLRRERDPFANPVGRALREGMKGIVACLLEKDLDAKLVCSHLEETLQIRAVQDCEPSQAISFIFLLRGVVVEVLGANASESEMARALTAFSKRIDQVAMFAFDIYVRHRERFYELRVNEVKRNVAGILRHWRGEDAATMAKQAAGGAAAQSAGREIAAF